MQVINFSEARKNLKTVIDQVIDDADYTIIARRDAPDAVMMSLDTFNGLMETVHLLKTPANAAHLARSIAQYRSGKLTHQSLVDAQSH
ncbi:MAG: type II toxin-antitoxin system Phd/YefM family antitoxin [Candidatus Contendobacter sp.]|jgi:antitoxin YefM|nr:type II toxin-antitoxin system Phd/YefM family antitoxin [Gammaproteobacteria bacterium]MCC8993832.1 type II toxin-antitoxin system Phd/YefM family antitoxin [Candidatus Contendobacter sp.]